MGWKDLVITPAVEVAILLVSLVCTLAVNSLISLSLFANAIIFYFLMLCWTIAVLKAIRVLFPIKEGVFSYSEAPQTCYIWNLHEPPLH